MQEGLHVHIRTLTTSGQGVHCQSVGPAASMEGLRLKCSGSWTGSIELTSLAETVSILHTKVCEAAGIDQEAGGGVKLIAGGRNLKVGSLGDTAVHKHLCMNLTIWMPCRPRCCLLYTRRGK